MELNKRLENRQPFKVIYDGDNFGTYKYNELEDLYIGEEVPWRLKIADIFRAINDPKYFIKVEVADE